MRLLVIEDEREIAEGLEAILRNESYLVDVVYDGANGLAYMLSNVYDLVLLDIMLPKINGIDLLKDARKQGIDTPVIILTAKSQIEDKIIGLDCGADDYMTKPFDAAELLARVRARTRISKDVDQDILRFGDIWISKTSQELGTEDKKIKLGNKEFQLMECFIINAKQIMQKDLLITKVWGPLSETEYNNLEVYISFLRKKLRFLKAKTSIKTTKNVGYSLEDNTSD